MRDTRLSAARFIFGEIQKARMVAESEQFDVESVDLSYIADEQEYYGWFTIGPSEAEHMKTECRKTKEADAGDCQGVGPQSYETTFEVVLYDGNSNLVPIFFSHSVSTDC